MMDGFARWEAFEPDQSILLDPSRVSETLAELAEPLRADYPYFHPRYAGQVLKPPHPVAMLAHAATMFGDPNNHALDGGKATSEMEKEVIPQLRAHQIAMDRAISRQRSGHWQSVDRLDRSCRWDRARLT
jgi:hypothetical protein